MNKPLVSIGLPVYNAEKFIERAVDSLLGQDYETFELIISDNASTDRTLQICKEYAIKDSRVRLKINSANIGIQDNFKKVFRFARGEYFMWAAADDSWESDFVSTLVCELEKNPRAGLAMCAVERRREDGQLLDVIRFAGNDDPADKSYLSVCLGFISTGKYNLFIYGLFRACVLKGSIHLWPEVSASDRWFLCLLSLGIKFSYVDKILQTKTLPDVKFTDRYPDDKLARIMLESGRELIDLKPLHALGRNILRSEFIPSYRKCFLPVILIKLLLYLVKHGTISAVHRFVRRPVFAGLRYSYRKRRSL